MSTTPKRFALLPDEIAVKHLTSGILRGDERPPAAALDQASKELPDEARWETERVRDLLNEAMARFEEDAVTAADAWLAPRLHSTLRITRREAAESGLWNHLALRVAPDYVRWRHLAKPTEKNPVPIINAKRFCGPFHTQAFARLWWAAELFRDGFDYRPVVAACKDQDVLNSILRFETVLHRPTAQAIISLISKGTVQGGREINALGKAVNSAGSTIAFEAIAPDSSPESDPYQDWIAAGDEDFTPYDRLPDGPDDGRTYPDSVAALTSLFERLFAEAPVRGREKKEENEQGEGGSKTA